MKQRTRHLGIFRALTGVALSALVLTSHAAGYLQTQEGIQALVGGTSGGYNQVLSPANSSQSAHGNDSVEGTAGPYYPGMAGQ